MAQAPVILIGLGNVGRALLRQVVETGPTLVRRTNLNLVPIGLADSQACLLNPDGLPEEALEAALEAKAAGRSLNSLPGRCPLSDLESAFIPGAVVVDLTTSADMVGTLRAALSAGGAVVLANKRPLCGPWAKARFLFDNANVRYEATVGAGLPVVAALRTLLDTGDQVTAVEGCMSGTLGFLCSQLEDGEEYSSAVSQARSLGYTEPDPREDLSGRDVARKALILARTSGWRLELSDLKVEPLFTKRLSTLSTRGFISAMPALDEPYARRVHDARSRGQVLRYVARIGPRGGWVGLAEVPREVPLGALRGPANHIAFHTKRYADYPLVISGPGAGPEVTAAGVLGDVIALALGPGVQKDWPGNS
jgi:homoserine dehydrogenase